MALQIQVITPAGLQAAADRLRQKDKELPGELRKLLANAVRPIIKEQKSRLRGLLVDGSSGSTGLRRELARGVKLKLRTGRGRRGSGPTMRIVTTVPGSSKKPNLAMMPRALDTEFDGWRSPLFGDRSHWVQHDVPSGPSWFMGPVQSKGNDIKQEIIGLLQATADDIASRAATVRALKKIK